MLKRLLVVVVLGFVAAPVIAAEQRLSFDPEATTISFTLDSTMHEVHGSFALESGQIAYDLETGNASGEILIDATVAQTGNKKRDRKMHDEVLETKRYPRFVFRAESVSGHLDAGGQGRVELRGTLEIHGESHELTLKTDISVEGNRLQAHSEFEIPYVEWGMEDPSVFIFRAAKVVDVVVEAEGRIAAQSTSPAP